ERLHLPRQDTVVAMDFTIVGQIDATSLKVKSPYFGDTSLQLSDLRSVRSLGSDREVRVAVDAARYGGPQEQWLETGVEVRSGALLQLVATGNVTSGRRPAVATHSWSARTGPVRASTERRP